jgi:hypothetical protein
MGDRWSPLHRSGLGRLSAISVSHSKSVLYDAFVWARRALNGPNGPNGRWFPARAVGWLFCCGTATRCKYYFAWKLAEAAGNASGLGLSKWDEKTGAPEPALPVLNTVTRRCVVQVLRSGTAAQTATRWHLSV